MRFFNFHLMPYPALPKDYDGPAWVTCPNELFDPDVGQQVYNRYLDELIYSEELGFDGVCVNEHHQNAYGLMPSPNLMAAILARQTKRMKIAVVGNALPLYDPPTRVAEEFAMIDNISNGRLIAGFVLEASFSVLVAPLMMMYHSRFVASILAGRNVPWDAQEREGRAVSWAAAWRSSGWITCVGIAWAGLTLYHSAAFFLWLVPIFLGLVASAPLIRFTSRPDWGQRARKHGLFLVPSETDPHPVLEESRTDRSWCAPVLGKGSAAVRPDEPVHRQAEPRSRSGIQIHRIQRDRR